MHHLLNSFWLLDEANSQARCLCVKDNAYAEDQVVALGDLGDIEYKEVCCSSTMLFKKVVSILIVNVLRRETLRRCS